MGYAAIVLAFAISVVQRAVELSQDLNAELMGPVFVYIAALYVGYGAFVLILALWALSGRDGSQSALVAGAIFTGIVGALLVAAALITAAPRIDPAGVLTVLVSVALAVAAIVAGRAASDATS